MTLRCRPNLGPNSGPRTLTLNVLGLPGQSTGQARAHSAAPRGIQDAVLPPGAAGEACWEGGLQLAGTTT
eukprot:4270032-Alexandrium_andersonii.AAC.1